MKKLLLILAIIASIYVWVGHQHQASSVTYSVSNATQEDDALARAFSSRAHGISVQGFGTVERILADDSEGDRHQRFILRMPSGQTVLIAHNIDIAPRVDPLAEGDKISFSGEYEWNAKGGVVHWTHHDPWGDHEAGWLEQAGQRFQ